VLPDWFSATVGGLGLTGVITEAEIQLRPVSGPWLDIETIPFQNLDEYSNCFCTTLGTVRQFQLCAYSLFQQKAYNQIERVPDLNQKQLQSISYLSFSNNKNIVC
jgi:hypothetical protein